MCYAPYILNNGTCQYYSTSCNISNYYFDARVRNCISCPNGCQTCYRTLCYTCLNNYYLDNGQCVSICQP